MKDAYLPPELKDSCLGKDYQRIANELRDRGTEIVWAGTTPYNKKLFPYNDCSVDFMYPTIMKEFRK
jgi:hypothetical protein